MAWRTDFEDPVPPGAPASEAVYAVFDLVPDPLVYIRMPMENQRALLRAICKMNNWYWPAVAKWLKRGKDGPPNRLTASQRSQQARRAADVSWARTVIAAERTAPGRKAFLNRFEREVDPEGRLNPKERQRRAHYATRAHMRGLALKSSLTRQRGRAR